MVAIRYGRHTTAWHRARLLVLFGYPPGSILPWTTLISGRKRQQTKVNTDGRDHTMIKEHSRTQLGDVNGTTPPRSRLKKKSQEGQVANS